MTLRAPKARRPLTSRHASPSGSRDPRWEKNRGRSGGFAGLGGRWAVTDGGVVRLDDAQLAELAVLVAGAQAPRLVGCPGVAGAAGP